MGLRHGDDGMKLIIVPHDIEEFTGIARRHGRWHSELDRFSEALNSTAIPGKLTALSVVEPLKEPDPQLENEDVWAESVRYVVERQTASTSMLQRRFNIGFQTASRLLDLMEARGIVGPQDGPRPRKALIGPLEVEKGVSHKVWSPTDSATTIGSITEKERGSVGVVGGSVKQAAPSAQCV